jgi:proline racemase
MHREAKTSLLKLGRYHGTVFAGRLLEETSVGPCRAVVPTISGAAWITGFATYVLDADDPFPEGFTVGDIW